MNSTVESIRGGLRAAGVSRVWVSLTTIPPRVEKCAATLESLADQTFADVQIIMNLPASYRRFPGATARAPRDWRAIPNLVVHRPQRDFGPMTKLLGALEVARDDSIVIVCDDDTIYGARAIEGILQKVIGDRAACWSGSGFPLMPYLRREPYRLLDEMAVDVVEGGYMIAVHPRWFAAASLASHMAQVEDLLFGDDDLAISNYLAGAGVARRIVFNDVFNREYSVRQPRHGFDDHALHRAFAGDDARASRVSLLRQLARRGLCHLPFTDG
jgi:hypothetical protein